MSLFKRGNVFWSYVWVDGVRHQRSTGTSNRKRAEKIDSKHKEELNDRRFQITEADPNMTFAELDARFIASGSVRPHHIYHSQFLLPFFGDVPVLRITKSLTEEYRRARHAGTSIKEATINRDLSVLRHILYWAVDEQLIPANPLARLRMARERRTRRQVLSVAEEQLLLPAAKGHLRTMVILALDTGMRRGEITGQRWEDIDFAQRVLYVTRSKTPEGESREIPLSARLQKLLGAQRQTDGLLIQFRGRPVKIIKTTWKTAFRDSQLRHVRFHDLRHTFNTRLMEAGVMQEVRMALMGHSSGSRVHSTYTHIELPVKREAIKKPEKWKIHEENLLKEQQTDQKQENTHASTETERSESGPTSSGSSAAGRRKARTQSVEKEDARRGGLGTS